jgi:hypothetical protein
MSEVGTGQAYVSRTGWGPLAAAIGVVLILGVAAGGANLTQPLISALAGAGAAGVKPPGAQDAEKAVQVAAWMGSFQVFAVVLTGIASLGFHSRPRDVLAFGAPVQGIGAYSIALGAVVSVTGVFTLAMWTFQREAMLADLRPFSELLNSEGGWVILPVIAVGAPVMEEMLFRGFLFSALAKMRTGLTGAALNTTVAWTALHAGYTLWGLAEVFTVGLVLSYVLVRTGSLRVPMFCHMAYNGLIALVLMTIELPK